MTDEVGVITGNLTIRTTRLTEHLVAVTVQYTDAEEWYALTGSPATVAAGNLEDYHAAVLAAIALGGEATAQR
ncbi:hypothetical protein [Streptomyces sp. NPDC093109]|uniref:hypothetical protein n=1 Tax=Streptomyces sp. NPDC093109 TaxID=3154977 RepID=UPI00344B5E26